MLDRLTSMSAFVKAAEIGSFTRAAVMLGLISQMLGKHVAALEQQISAPLLQRTTRRQSLIETGRQFYDRCRVILAEADVAYALQEAAAAPCGRLRLSAPVGFEACWLAPMVGSFLQHHPDIAVELNLTDRLVDLVDEGYDAALRLGPVEETRLAVRDLCPHPQVLCAAPSYLARRGAPATPRTSPSTPASA